MTGSIPASAIIGRSTAIQRLRAQIAKAARSPLPVMIEGPTGAGKELVAEALHVESRRSGPLVAVNVSAIAEGLFEDNLFGHVRGAFTGALSDHDGFLTEAHNGTFFLDEVGTLSHVAQAKLLRVIETRRFRPLGARADRCSDFRLVAASNQPLADLVARGAFREDLAHRLSGLTLQVPPLASRMEDVPELASHFAVRFADIGGRRARLGDSALTALLSYDWPGNVRELRGVVEAAITLSDDMIVDRHDVESLLLQRRTVAAGREAMHVERQRMQELLEENGGDTARVAAALGVDRGTVYRRLKQLGIPTPRQQRREPDRTWPLGLTQ